MLLGHRNGDITSHYPAPELVELIYAANKVFEGNSGKTPTLMMLKKKALIKRTVDLMDAAVPDALVTEYEPLIDGLTLPDAKDWHVLAAAVGCSASVIVTFNEKDFPAS